MEEEAEYSQGAKNILYVAIVFSILSFLLLVILIYGEGSDTLLWISMILIIIASALVLLVVI